MNCRTILLATAVPQQVGRCRRGAGRAVSKGSHEQAGGTAQIAKALTDMESVTQRGAATAEESAAAARELDSQAQALSGIVADIAALVGQKRAA